MNHEVVWSVIILLCGGMAFTGYCVAYILIMAYKEMQDGIHDTPEQEELLQLPSDEH